MAKYKLIYFKGCPNYMPAEQLLKDSGIDFQSICQDELSNSDPLKNYSSPTLLIKDKIIFGSKTTGGGCSVLLPSKGQLLELLKNS